MHKSIISGDDSPRKMRNKKEAAIGQQRHAGNKNSYSRANFLKKVSKKQSNSQVHQIDSSKINSEQKFQDFSFNKLANKEAIDEDKELSSRKSNDDDSPQRVIELIKAQKHLGVFQEGKISKSPRPAEDFRVQYNFWILRTLIIIIILTEIITSPTPMIADSAVVHSLAGSSSDYGKQRLFGFFWFGLSSCSSCYMGFLFHILSLHRHYKLSSLLLYISHCNWCYSFCKLILWFRNARKQRQWHQAAGNFDDF